jgi:nicotinamidase-related amidase
MGKETRMATPHPMTLAREGTTLLIVDVQERLFPAMDADHREEVMRNIKVLAAAARRLRLPVVVTEQYPKGLGHTLRELHETLGPEVQPVAKVSFSCWGAEEVRVRLKAAGTRSVILAGIEAHVCVLISALDLMSEGLAVHVAADAVTSRTQANWRLGTEQLRQAGAVVSASETLVFQLLGQADTDDFRELSRLLR